MRIAPRRKVGNLETYKSLLVKEQAELVKRLYERRSQVASEHDVDDEAAHALESTLNDFTIGNMEREIRTLAEVELSLRLLDNGQYGWCGGCGCEIPVARLQALPWTRTCVNCAGGGINRGHSLSHETARVEAEEIHD